MSGLTPLLYTTFALEFIMVFCLFQLSLLNERQTIREELIAEAEEYGTVPHEHVPFFGNSWSRSLQRFAAPGVAQDSYVKMATLLAFRRAQARTAPAKVQAFYAEDLNRVRGEGSNHPPVRTPPNGDHIHLREAYSSCFHTSTALDAVRPLPSRASTNRRLRPLSNSGSIENGIVSAPSSPPR